MKFYILQLYYFLHEIFYFIIVLYCEGRLRAAATLFCSEFVCRYVCLVCQDGVKVPRQNINMSRSRFALSSDSSSTIPLLYLYIVTFCILFIAKTSLW